MLVFFAMLTGAFSLSAAGNNVEVFAKSRVAAFQIFKLIDRESPIDPLSTSGKMVDKNIKPEITFKDVSFTYPAREDQQILFKVSFKAEVGKTLALCGQSGSGKSTCIQLIQRFYDPQEGGVYFGGVDVKTLNVKSLREEIGVVSQEPVLFDASIKGLSIFLDRNF
jgi:ABC-type multidrug transport system fused ATPase/permease subunit